MIQFNLLPDIKITSIKARNTMRLVILGSAVVAAVCFLVLIAIFTTVSFQKAHINNLAKQLNTDSSNLHNTSNLNQILQVKNQLNTLPLLDAQKPVVSRLSGYLTQLTPTAVFINRLTVDFVKNTVDINGTADTLATVNQFVDTLKFSTYTTSSTGSDATSKLAFSNVILSSFGYTNSTGASYTVDFSFDPTIFSSDYNVTLTVPNTITTRSEIDQPTILFNQKPSSTNTNNSPTNSGSSH